MTTSPHGKGILPLLCVLSIFITIIHTGLVTGQDQLLGSDADHDMDGVTSPERLKR